MLGLLSARGLVRTDPDPDPDPAATATAHANANSTELAADTAPRVDPARPADPPHTRDPHCAPGPGPACADASPPPRAPVSTATRAATSAPHRSPGSGSAVASPRGVGVGRAWPTPYDDISPPRPATRCPPLPANIGSNLSNSRTRAGAGNGGGNAVSAPATLSTAGPPAREAREAERKAKRAALQLK